MTPTLLGRWQTRILLFALIGLPMTLVYAVWIGGFPPPVDPFLFLATLFVLGMALEPVYFQMQRFRWDQDWPFAFFVFFSILEFLIVFGVVRLDWLPYLPACEQARIDPATREVVCQIPTVPFAVAAWHFAVVFVPMLLAVLAGIQVFLVRWRFKGGELGRFPASD